VLEIKTNFDGLIIDFRSWHYTPVQKLCPLKSMALEPVVEFKAAFV